MHTRRIKALTIHHDIILSVPKRPFQTRQLQRPDFVNRGNFYRIKAAARGH
jgi:hypothetical protein